MSTVTSRVRDFGERAGDFIDEVLVQCPHCGSCAVHRPLQPVGEGASAVLFAPRRLTCTGCGFSKRWAERSLQRVSLSEPKDDYFALPLWLQQRCGSEIVWAYNERHLAFLEDYVGAHLRERSPDALGWSNRSMASRLPRWIKKASRRAEVLKALAKMRGKLPPAR